MMDKTDIRNKIRELKLLQDSQSLQSQSEKIMSLLEMHERFQKAHVVLVYHALPDEPKIQIRLDEWRKTKCVLLPVVREDHLIIREYRGLSSLVEGAFHIMEPVGPIFLDYKSIDMAVVPGVAFDAHCNRLGRGKGYYDRLLSQSDFRKVYKLGVCFDFQKIAEIPTTDNDIRMDEVL